MNVICLNMIVKNEAHVIRRCLTAVKDYIDYWVIVDTGSTDGTQEIIREVMQGYPGELYERKWVNFEHNRNEALDLACSKALYSFFVDADEIMHFSPQFNSQTLKKNYYFLKTIAKGQEFYFPKLIRNDRFWRWEGVLHESVQHPGDVEGDTCLDIWTESIQDGARSRDSEKNERDIEILKQAIQDHPDNSRYVFYLAQSYFTDRRFEEAIKAYAKRCEMEGAHDEKFWSFFAIGQIEEHLGMPSEKFLKSYEKAYVFDSGRAEPLERMANYYLQSGSSLLAYSLARQARSLPVPFPMSSGFYGWVYHFAVDLIYADAAVDLGKLEEGQDVYRALLSKTDIPSSLILHARSQVAKIDQCLQLKKDLQSMEFAKLPITLSFLV